MKKPFRLCLLLLLATLNLQLPAAPLGTAFIYQGRLTDGANPANGSYDLRFTLCDAVTNGNAIGSLTNLATGITNGLFTATLDFGGVFNGSNCWLELAARTNGDGAFTSLYPRQPILPAPYALYAATAGSATAATSANTLASTNFITQWAGIAATGAVASATTATTAASATTLTGINTASIVTNGPFFLETGAGTDVSVNLCEQDSLNYANVGPWKYWTTNATLGEGIWTNAINRTNYLLFVAPPEGFWMFDTRTNDAVDFTTTLFAGSGLITDPWTLGDLNTASTMQASMGGTAGRVLTGLNIQNSTVSGSVTGNVSGAMSGTFYGSYTGALSGFLLKLTNTISDFEGYGDSITASNQCSGTNTFFNAYLAPTLIRRFNCFITNGAQAGASIYQVSNQYAAYGHFITFPPNTTAIVSLEAGGNANSISSNSLIGSFSNLCVQVHADGKKVLAYTIYGFPASGGLSVDQEGYNGWLRAATNYWDWLIDLDAIINVNTDLCDGIHLSTNGPTYKVFTNIMQTILPGSLVTQPVVVNEVLADTIYGTHIGTFTGNGSGLTNVPAGAIVGGLTANLAVLVPGGGTNTLCFTNGVLRAIQ
jgi:hypothetical protein